MRRVSVVGCPGSGKSTVARELADRLGVAHVELDAVFHQPAWGELPVGEFRRRVTAALGPDGWVVDGNYAAVQDLVWARADTVVWLDLSRSTVTRRIVGRTLRRVVARQELWNGNRESWRNLSSLDPERSIIAWSWTRHPIYRERYGAAIADAVWGDLRFVRLRSPRQVREFLGSGWSALG